MLPCLRPSQPPIANSQFSSPASQGYSVDDTPRSIVQPSPTVNLITREYTFALQTDSYGEIRQTFDREGSFDCTLDVEEIDLYEESQLLEQVLRPNHDSIQEALSHIQPSPVRDLVDSYFKHTENLSRLCLLLYQSLHRARLLYSPLHNLLDDLPLEFDSNSSSLTHSLSNWAFDIFLQFDNVDNPFSPDSYNFSDMRLCFSQLRQQLDDHLRKSESMVRRLRSASSGSSLSYIAAAVGVAISAVAVATHALVKLVASPVCPAKPSNMSKKELAHLAQLDAAAKGTYVLHNDLDTIDCLVSRLHSEIENDKLLIRMGLKGGRDRYLIQEILKKLRRNRVNFGEQLVVLEEHLFLCFAAINRARSLLLREIHLHQINYSETDFLQ